MKKISSCLFMAIFIGNGYAGTMGAIAPEPNAYISVFGGGGTLSSLSTRLLGSVFFTTADGGPLGINAFGHIKSHSEWIVGANAGYISQNVSFPFYTQGVVKPAVEVEGYYIGKNTLNAFEVNNNTTRLTEHLFGTSYPMQSGVGLVNAVMNFTLNNYPQWQPYVGGGIGAAVVSITNAIGTQTSPAEVGINHFNSDPSHSDTAFAAQGKAGLSYQWTPNLSIFGEYRYLYLSATTFMMGSTSYATHAETGPWTVKLGSQSYNLGSAGIRYLF